MTVEDPVMFTKPWVLRPGTKRINRAGDDAAGLMLALFHGLMFQALLDPTLAIEGRRMVSAQARFAELLPDRSR